MRPRSTSRRSNECSALLPPTMSHFRRPLSPKPPCIGSARCSVGSRSRNSGWPDVLVEQTAINFAANVFSAAFGLLNVIIFTRLFAPAEFGTYVLGAGFAAIVSTFLCSWLRLPIMREQARGDGTDVRGIILPGLMLSCLLAPLAYVAARLAGLTNGAAVAAIGLAIAIGLFE